jgi:hypothetical protein
MQKLRKKMTGKPRNKEPGCKVKAGIKNKWVTHYTD